MAKIKSYPNASPVVGTDKWIGSDSQNKFATKNFTADSVAAYINIAGKVEGQVLRYEYQNILAGETRKIASISFLTDNAGDNVLFTDIGKEKDGTANTYPKFVLSRYMVGPKDVYNLYDDPYKGSKVLITKCTDPSVFAVWEWNSATQLANPNQNFWEIGVTRLTSNGGLEKDEDYFISLLTYKGEGVSTVVVDFPTQQTVWQINHGLDAYPSVTTVDTANEQQFGLVEYIDAAGNNSRDDVRITFTAPGMSGKAFLN